jgi:hypothetical protein
MSEQDSPPKATQPEDTLEVTLNKRNTASLNEALKQESAARRALQQRVDSMQGTITMCLERIGQLEQALAIYKAMARGTGPTGPR